MVVAVSLFSSSIAIALVVAAPTPAAAESITDTRAASKPATPMPGPSTNQRLSAVFAFSPASKTDCSCDGHLSETSVGLGGSLGYSYRLLPHFALGLRATLLVQDDVNSVAVPVVLGFPMALSKRVELEPALGLGWRRWSSGGGGWSANGASAAMALGVAVGMGRGLFLLSAASVEAGMAVIHGGNAYVAGQSLVAFNTPFELGLRYAF